MAFLMMPLLPVSDIVAFPVLLKVLHRQTFNGVSGILQTGNIGISDRKLGKKCCGKITRNGHLEIFKMVSLYEYLSEVHAICT